MEQIPSSAFQMPRLDELRNDKKETPRTKCKLLVCYGRGWRTKARAMWLSQIPGGSKVVLWTSDNSGEVNNYLSSTY